jgi:glucuronate isomerase
MSQSLRQRLFEALDAIHLIDPHTHINPHAPAAKNLSDILGYHYYTELAHSAGLPRTRIEEPGLDPREKVRRLAAHMEPLRNTIQYSWLMEMLHALFDIEAPHLTAENCDAIYDATAQRMAADDWSQQVLDRSRLEAVFLTNDFDDPLEGFDTGVYVPCLRTDDLVFHLGRSQVRQRLESSSGVSLGDVASLRKAIAARFEHFKARGARACAISLPPDFTPAEVSDSEAQAAWSEVAAKGEAASPQRAAQLSRFVFWTLAGYCRDFGLPFDLMIGVNRGVYADGVFQGQDLYDSRVSLIQYRALFNTFSSVVFPISVLASVTNQELVSYSWIFPNVYTSGHWWYSNTPTFIEHDAAARLEAVPQTKQVAYYSDMYKLEFALPKFRMYKRILAKILAERFVVDRGWDEQQAVDLGQKVLRGNVEAISHAG